LGIVQPQRLGDTSLAAAIYTDEEVRAMVALRKEIPHSEWQNSRRNRQDADNSVVFHAVSEGHEIIFTIETVTNPILESCSFTLSVEVPPRPRRAIARYSIDDGDHENPLWFQPPEVLGGTPHRHIMSKRAIDEEGKWDACAEVLTGLRHDNANDLLGRFLADMNIHFVEKETHQSLFGFVNGNG